MAVPPNNSTVADWLGASELVAPLASDTRFPPGSLRLTVIMYDSTVAVLLVTLTATCDVPMLPVGLQVVIVTSCVASSELVIVAGRLSPGAPGVTGAAIPMATKTANAPPTIHGHRRRRLGVGAAVMGPGTEIGVSSMGSMAWRANFLGSGGVSGTID